jgi:hypothetical protein
MQWKTIFSSWLRESGDNYLDARRSGLDGHGRLRSSSANNQRFVSFVPLMPTMVNQPAT